MSDITLPLLKSVRFYMYTKTKIDTTTIDAISVYTHNIDHDSARVNIQKAYIYFYSNYHPKSKFTVEFE